MLTKVTPQQLVDLKYWLIIKGVRDTNIERQFSDGCTLAFLVHQMYPELLDKNEYRRYKEVPRKYNTWCLLNLKVLAQLGIYLENDELLNIANAKKGFVQRLLVIIMAKDKSWVYSEASSKLD